MGCGFGAQLPSVLVLPKCVLQLPSTRPRVALLRLNHQQALQLSATNVKAELQKLRVDKRRTKSELTLALEAAALEAKQPWAYSPSGRWRPGLWSGAQDRNTPISRRLGEPAKSIALVDLLPLGTSSLYSA